MLWPSTTAKLALHDYHMDSPRFTTFLVLSSRIWGFDHLNIVDTSGKLIQRRFSDNFACCLNVPGCIAEVLLGETVAFWISDPERIIPVRKRKCLRKSICQAPIESYWMVQNPFVNYMKSWFLSRDSRWTIQNLQSPNYRNWSSTFCLEENKLRKCVDSKSGEVFAMKIIEKAIDGLGPFAA